MKPTIDDEATRKTKPPFDENLYSTIEMNADFKKFPSILATKTVLPKENFAKTKLNEPRKHQENSFFRPEKTVDRRKVNPNEKNSRSSRSPSSWSVLSNYLNENHSSKRKTNPFVATVIGQSKAPIGKASNLNDKFLFFASKSDDRTNGCLSFLFSSQKPPFAESSSHHTYPFVCTAEFDLKSEHLFKISSTNISKTSFDPKAVPKQENFDEQKPAALTNLVQINEQDRSLLFSAKFTKSIEADDLSTNYDSEDGWSNDSAEFLYVEQSGTLHKNKI